MSIVFIICAVVFIPFLFLGGLFEKYIHKFDEWMNKDKE